MTALVHTPSFGMWLTIMNRFFSLCGYFRRRMSKSGNIFPSGHAGNGQQKGILINSYVEGDIFCNYNDLARSKYQLIDLGIPETFFYSHDTSNTLNLTVPPGYLVLNALILR